MDTILQHYVHSLLKSGCNAGFTKALVARQSTRTTRTVQACTVDFSGWPTRSQMHLREPTTLTRAAVDEHSCAAVASAAIVGASAPATIVATASTTSRSPGCAATATSHTRRGRCPPLCPKWLLGIARPWSAAAELRQKQIWVGRTWMGRFVQSKESGGLQQFGTLQALMPLAALIQTEAINHLVVPNGTGEDEEDEKGWTR